MKKIFLLLILILSLPLISAYNGYEFSPADIFENEWVLFSLTFLVFFAITYFALARAMRENKGGAAVIAGVIALFIAAAISQRTRFYGYVGVELGNWLFIIAVLIGFILLAKVLMSLGGIFLFVILYIAWFILNGIDAHEIFPYSVLESNTFNYLWSFFTGIPAFGILTAIFVALIIAAFAGNKPIKKWLIWHKEKEIPPWWRY